MYGRWVGLAISGRLREAMGTATEMCELASRTGEEWIEAAGKRNLAVAQYLMGDLETARGNLQWVLAYSKRMPAELPAGFSHDPVLGAPSPLTHTEWALGDVEAAMCRSADIVTTISCRTKNANTVAYALTWDLLLQAFARDPDGLRMASDRLLDHTDRTGGMFWKQMGLWARGATEALKRNGRAALPLLTAGLDGFVATGGLQHVPFLQLYVAEALLFEGNSIAALDIIEDSRKIIRQTEQRFYEPEMHRVRGVVLESVGQTDEAVAAFRAAISVAGIQGSRTWQARAEESLANILERH